MVFAFRHMEPPLGSRIHNLDHPTKPTTHVLRGAVPCCGAAFFHICKVLRTPWKTRWLLGFDGIWFSQQEGLVRSGERFGAISGVWMSSAWLGLQSEETEPRTKQRSRW